MGNNYSRQNLIKSSIFGPKHSILKTRGSLHSLDSDCEDCPCCRDECDCIYEKINDKPRVKTVVIVDGSLMESLLGKCGFT